MMPSRPESPRGPLLTSHPIQDVPAVITMDTPVPVWMASREFADEWIEMMHAFSSMINVDIFSPLFMVRERYRLVFASFFENYRIETFGDLVRAFFPSFVNNGRSASRLNDLLAQFRTSLFALNSRLVAAVPAALTSAVEVGPEDSSNAFHVEFRRPDLLRYVWSEINLRYYYSKQDDVYGPISSFNQASGTGKTRMAFQLAEDFPVLLAYLNLRNEIGDRHVPNQSSGIFKYLSEGCFYLYRSAPLAPEVLGKLADWRTYSLRWTSLILAYLSVFREEEWLWSQHVPPVSGSSFPSPLMVDPASLRSEVGEVPQLFSQYIGRIQQPGSEAMTVLSCKLIERANAYLECMRTSFLDLAGVDCTIEVMDAFLEKVFKFFLKRSNSATAFSIGNTFKEDFGRFVEGGQDPVKDVKYSQVELLLFVDEAGSLVPDEDLSAPLDSGFYAFRRVLSCLPRESGIYVIVCDTKSLVRGLAPSPNDDMSDRVKSGLFSLLPPLFRIPSIDVFWGTDEHRNLPNYTLGRCLSSTTLSRFGRPLFGADHRALVARRIDEPAILEALTRLAIGKLPTRVNGASELSYHQKISRSFAIFNVLLKVDHRPKYELASSLVASFSHLIKRLSPNNNVAELFVPNEPFLAAAAMQLFAGDERVFNSHLEWFTEVIGRGSVNVGDVAEMLVRLLYIKLAALAHGLHPSPSPRTEAAIIALCTRTVNRALTIEDLFLPIQFTLEGNSQKPFLWSHLPQALRHASVHFNYFARTDERLTADVLRGALARSASIIGNSTQKAVDFIIPMVVGGSNVPLRHSLSGVFVQIKANAQELSPTAVNDIHSKMEDLAMSIFAESRLPFVTVYHNISAGRQRHFATYYPEVNTETADGKRGLVNSPPHLRLTLLGPIHGMSVFEGVRDQLHRLTLTAISLQHEPLQGAHRMDPFSANSRMTPDLTAEDRFKNAPLSHSSAYFTDTCPKGCLCVDGFVCPCLQTHFRGCVAGCRCRCSSKIGGSPTPSTTRLVDERQYPILTEIAETDEGELSDVES